MRPLRALLRIAILLALLGIGVQFDDAFMGTAHLAYGPMLIDDVTVVFLTAVLLPLIVVLSIALKTPQQRAAALCIGIMAAFGVLAYYAAPTSRAERQLHAAYDVERSLDALGRSQSFEKLPAEMRQEIVDRLALLRDDLRAHSQHLLAYSKGASPPTRQRLIFGLASFVFLGGALLLLGGPATADPARHKLKPSGFLDWLLR